MKDSIAGLVLNYRFCLVLNLLCCLHLRFAFWLSWKNRRLGSCYFTRFGRSRSLRNSIWGLLSPKQNLLLFTDVNSEINAAFINRIHCKYILQHSATFLGTALLISLFDSFLVNSDQSRCSNSKDVHIEIQVLLHIKRLNVSGQYANKLPSFLWNLYHNYMICRGNHAWHYEEVIVSCLSQSGLYWCCNILSANCCKKASVKNLVKSGRKPGEIWIKE